jgi:hypothetical protein
MDLKRLRLTIDPAATLRARGQIKKSTYFREPSPQWFVART